MQWILGRRESPLLLTEDGRRDWNSFLAAQFSQDDLCYAGFLWGDTLDLAQTITRLHPRLCFDFQAGWSAVGFVVRKGGRVLGPWSAPTTARAHSKAPVGLYLLSPQRLQASVQAWPREFSEFEQACSLIHGKQEHLGPVFCDPNLELTLPHLARDFQYQAPSKMQVLRSAAKFLFSPGAFS